jgi:hypothetical protein
MVSLDDPSCAQMRPFADVLYTPFHGDEGAITAYVKQQVKIVYPWSFSDPLSAYMLLSKIQSCLREHDALQRENAPPPVLKKPPTDNMPTFPADPEGPDAVQPTAQAGPKESIAGISAQLASVPQQSPSEALVVENRQFVNYNIVDRIEWSKPLSDTETIVPAKTPQAAPKIQNVPTQVQNAPHKEIHGNNVDATNAQINNIVDEVDRHIETKVEVSLKRTPVVTQQRVPLKNASNKLVAPATAIFGVATLGALVYVS